MKELKKEIILDETKTISYNVNGDSIPIHTITENNINNYPRNIQFCKWEDYCFKSWYALCYEDYKLVKNESHNFDKDHPLYLPLMHLLNGKKELIIDDDETQELNKKYMRILFDDGIININFINKFNNDDSMNKFSIFIKNVNFDLRSKIDCQKLDTKERLYFFFEELYTLFDEYHQTTIEEYLLSNNYLSLEESKKYVKKFNN